MISNAQARAVLPKLAPEIKRFAFEMAQYAPARARRYLKFQARQLIQLSREPELDLSGLTKGQKAVIQVLRRGGLTQKQLIAATGYRRSSVSSALNVLLVRGVVVASRDFPRIYTLRNY